MAISAGDIVTLRTSGRHVVTPRLDLFPLTVVATAKINQSTFLYPLATLTVDNTSRWASVEYGQLVRITNGSGATVLWTVCRKAPTATELYISAISQGDSGYAQDVAVSLADNYDITVYSSRPLWGYLSRIYNSVFYKRFDVAYTDEGSSPAPVCNIGAWQSGDTSTTFTLTTAGTTASFAWGSKTLSSYSWTLPTGVTLASGTLTSSAITVTASAGAYIIGCTVTDSGSKTHTAYTYLFVENASKTQSFGSNYRWQVEKDESTRDGREIGLTIWGSNLADVIYPGAPVLYTEASTFNGTAVSSGVMVDKFCGYIDDFTFSHDGDIPTAQVTVKSPMLMLKNIPMATQAVFEKTSPANWTEITSDLSNPAGMIWYLAQHHCPALLQMHDYDRGGLTTPRKKSQSFQQRDLMGQLQAVAQLILGNVGSADDGTTVLRQNPMYESNSFRNALDNRFTWGDSDILPPLTYPFHYRMKTGQTTGYAFAYGGTSEPTPYASIAGKAQAQGVGTQQAPDFIVTTAGGQTRVNEVVGHYHQELNNPVPELSWTVDRNLDIIRPAYMEWHTLTVDATYDPRGVGWSSARMLPTRVSRRWQEDNGNWVKSITATFQPETFGQPGVYLPINRGTADQYLDVGVDSPFEQVEDQNTQIGLLLPINSAGKIALTFTGLDDAPAYGDIATFLTGTVCDVCWDYNCEFMTSGFASGALRAFVVTAGTTDLNIYLYDDLRISDSATLLKTYTMNDSSVNYSARIECSRSTANFVAAHWKDQTGCYVGRSTDGGTTWGAAVSVGSTASDTGNDDVDIGFAIEGAKQLAIGKDASNNYKLYYASTTGGAFAALGSAVASTIPSPLAVVDTQGYAYTTVPGSGGTGIGDVFEDWDGGFVGANVDVEGVGSHNGSTFPVIVTGAGNPGFAEYATGTGFSAIDVWMVLTYTFLTPITVNSIQLDVKVNRSSTGTTNLQYQNGGFDTLHTFATTVAGENNTWVTKSASGLGLTSVSDLRIYVYITSYTGDASMYLDNIYINPTGGGGGGTSKLYRIATYAGTPAWVDITPSSYVPTANYGVAVNRAAKNTIHSFGTAGGAYHWHDSANQGTAFTDEGAYAGARGAAWSGDIGVVWGSNTLDLTVDNGATFLDRRGDLGVVWGAVGTIRKVLCLL